MDLQKYCDTDESIHGSRLMTPWSKGDHTFATNGHIIIRVPRTDAPERKNAPGLSELEHWFKTEPVEWYPIPPVNPKKQPCEECNGKGKHKYQGTFINCEECDGTGEYMRHLGIEIGEAKFSDVYLSWIAELPGAEIGPFKAMDPARFRFTGGEGLLMPRKKLTRR